MSVFDLGIGESAKIVKITAEGAAASRLKALGFGCGQRVTVLGFSLFRSSILAGVGATRIALRRAVAQKIEVEACR